jgi:hypothetical protein
LLPICHSCITQTLSHSLCIIYCYFPMYFVFNTCSTLEIKCYNSWSCDHHLYMSARLWAVYLEGTVMQFNASFVINTVINQQSNSVEY